MLTGCMGQDLTVGGRNEVNDCHCCSQVDDFYGTTLPM